MTVLNIYTSVACSRTPQSADWGKNGLIAFAACNSFAIFDPKYKGSAKIIRTYTRHFKRIITVKWIQKDPGEDEVLVMTGADDGLAILWNITDIDNPKCTILEGHESGVNVIDAIFVNDKLTLATASTDSTIKLWDKHVESGKYEHFQTLELQTGFCFALRMVTFPGTNDILLTYAGDDDNIYLFTELFKEDKDSRHFVKIHHLVGHSDWVRSLDFIQTDEGDMLLASCSQDHYIRLWRISPRSQKQYEVNKVNLFDMPEGDINVEEKILKFQSNLSGETLYFAVSLESVLHGHEGWVYAVHWNKNESGLRLLSCSIDKTLIIWSCSDEGIWIENVRVGEVGGNSLGFYGGKFSKDGKAIFGHGFQGSFHIWNQTSDDDNIWEPGTVVGGHYAQVRDICWEPGGQYLFSVSMDQTTRIHAPWIRSNVLETTWHEIARPQVHGYDMQCITVLSKYKFASGAEEKIVRTFQAPANFIENFRRICNIINDEEGDQILENIPKGASVPSLGLSNKAVFNYESEEEKDKHVKDMYPENYFVPATLVSPPQEETLMQNTLWPEVQKLYGHGFEIFAVCSSSDGKILASSCKASNAEHAQIILWNTSTWKQLQKLSSHQLTVTQMKFSPDNKYLLSVSRDRHWTIFENNPINGHWEVSATTDKKNGIHGRIIWSCDWSHDSKIFATSSRDGKAVAWTRTDECAESSLKHWKSLDCLELKNESITAIAFARSYLKSIKGEYLVALGLETGVVEICSFTGVWKKLLTIVKDYAHHLAVKKLHFKPNCNEYFLASCGEDHFVRINKIEL